MHIRYNETVDLWQYLSAVGPPEVWSTLPIDYAQLTSGVPGLGTFLTNTDTGTKTAWAPGISKNTSLHWSGASDLTIQGIAGGTTGLKFKFKNVGSKWAWFTHASGSASAGDRLTNIVTSSFTPVAPGGWIEYQHDGTNWKLIDHNQGAWITPTYNSANWAATTGIWTVESGDILTDLYLIYGKSLFYQIAVAPTSVSAVTSFLTRTLYGYTASKRFDAVIQYTDNGATTAVGALFNNAATTTFLFLRGGSLSWSISTNNTNVIASGFLEVT